MPVLLRHHRQVEQTGASKRIAAHRHPGARPARVHIGGCRRGLAVHGAGQLQAAADRLGHRVGGVLLVVLIAQQRRTTGQLGVHQLIARGDTEPVLHLGILANFDALAGRHQRRHCDQNRRRSQRTDLLGNRQHPRAVGQQAHRPPRRDVVDPTVDGQPRRLLGPDLDRRVAQRCAHLAEQRDIRAVRSEVLDLATGLNLQRRNIPVTAEGFAGQLSNGVLLRLNREHRQAALFHRGLERLHAFVHRRRLRPAGGRRRGLARVVQRVVHAQQKRIKRRARWQHGHLLERRPHRQLRPAVRLLATPDQAIGIAIGKNGQHLGIAHLIGRRRHIQAAEVGGNRRPIELPGAEGVFEDDRIEHRERHIGVAVARPHRVQGLQLQGGAIERGRRTASPHAPAEVVQRTDQALGLDQHPDVELVVDASGGDARNAYGIGRQRHIDHFHRRPAHCRCRLLDAVQQVGALGGEQHDVTARRQSGGDHLTGQPGLRRAVGCGALRVGVDVPDLGIAAAGEQLHITTAVDDGRSRAATVHGAGHAVVLHEARFWDDGDGSTGVRGRRR
ncbi:hypothetical protein D3C76_755860 [compost metagenome]